MYVCCVCRKRNPPRVIIYGAPAHWYRDTGTQTHIQHGALSRICAGRDCNQRKRSKTHNGITILWQFSYNRLLCARLSVLVSMVKWRSTNETLTAIYLSMSIESWIQLNWRVTAMISKQACCRHVQPHRTEAIKPQSHHNHNAHTRASVQTHPAQKRLCGNTTIKRWMKIPIPTSARTLQEAIAHARRKSERIPPSPNGTAYSWPALPR